MAPVGVSAVVALAKIWELALGEAKHVVPRCRRNLARGGEDIIASSRDLGSGGNVVVDGVQVWVWFGEKIQRVGEFPDRDPSGVHLRVQ